MQRTLATHLAGLILISSAPFISTSAAASTTLLDIYQLAIEHDPQYRGVNAAYRATLETKSQSRAQLFPSINLTADRTSNKLKTISASSFPVGTRDFDSSGYTLSLNQPLLNYDYFIQLRQSDAAIGEARANLSAAQQALMVRISERYFDALAALDSLEFARAEKRAIDRQLEQTRQRFEVGLIAITGVHEAQAAYDLVTAQEILAENLLASQYEALAEITGRYHKTLATLSAETPLITPEPADIGKWGDTALNQNFQLIAAEFVFNNAREEIKRQRAGHLPTLELNASHTYTDSEGGNFGSNESENQSIELRLNMPLFQGGATSSRTRQAKRLADQSREGYEQQRRATLRQARDAYLSVLAEINRVKALEQAVVSAQSALDATEAGLEVGTRTTVDVLDTRRELFRAQRDHARSRYDYILHTLRLKQAAGILTTADLELINSWLQTRAAPVAQAIEPSLADTPTAIDSE
jgi:outer membrane protein